MDNEILDRVRQRLDCLQISPRAASLEAGLNAHYLQKLFAGKATDITISKLKALASVLETSPEWLMSGRGPEHLPHEVASFMDALTNKLDDQGKQTVMDMIDFEIERSETRKTSKD